MRTDSQEISMRRARLPLLALVAASALACSPGNGAPEAGESSISAERERRQKAIAEIAPVPVPAPASAAAGSGDGAAAPPFPLIGEDGIDRYGYPKRYVDR